MEKLPDGSPLALEVAEGIAVLTLSRPEARNAINTELRTGLIRVLGELAADPTVRALVITGAGSAFCAGGDIAAMRRRLEAPLGEVGIQGWRHQRGGTHHLVVALNGFEKPTVAAVNGPAAGLGADLALACDFIIASELGAFIYSYAERGLIPDGGGLHFLPRRVGLARAKELMFSARRVAGPEAVDLGLADRLAAPDQLVSDAIAWAKDLSKHSPIAVALTKALLNRTFETSLDGALAAGAQAQAICYASDEHRASVETFLGSVRRDPR